MLRIHLIRNSLFANLNSEFISKIIANPKICIDMQIITQWTWKLENLIKNCIWNFKFKMNINQNPNNSENWFQMINYFINYLKMVSKCVHHHVLEFPQSQMMSTNRSSFEPFLYRFYSMWLHLVDQETNKLNHLNDEHRPKMDSETHHRRNQICLMR